MLIGTFVYAAEGSSGELSEVKDEFTFGRGAPEQKPDTRTVAERVMLIEANMQFVKITAALYAFSLIIIIIFMWDKKHQAKDIVTMVGMVSVIFGTLLLVLMIANTEQLTAPMGILGAIAGYLFGRTGESTNISKKTEESGEG